MTSGEEAIFNLESIIRGHLVYKDIWSPTMGEILKNEHDRRPRSQSRFFLGRCGRISCEVTLTKHGKELEDSKSSLFSPDRWICVECDLNLLHKCVCLTASNKTRKGVCAYDKVCTYKKDALNNPSLR